MSGATDGERSEGESGSASAPAPPGSGSGLRAGAPSQIAGEISPVVLLARSARCCPARQAAAAADRGAPTAVTRPAMRAVLASFSLLASLPLTRSARCSMRMPTVSESTTATQKAYMASRPRMRRSMLTWLGLGLGSGSGFGFGLGLRLGLGLGFGLGFRFRFGFRSARCSPGRPRAPLVKGRGRRQSARGGRRAGCS